MEQRFIVMTHGHMTHRFRDKSFQAINALATTTKDTTTKKKYPQETKKLTTSKKDTGFTSF